MKSGTTCSHTLGWVEGCNLHTKNYISGNDLQSTYEEFCFAFGKPMNALINLHKKNYIFGRRMDLGASRSGSPKIVAKMAKGGGPCLDVV